MSVPTHKPGGQFGNDNAAKNHVREDLSYPDDIHEAKADPHYEREQLYWYNSADHKSLKATINYTGVGYLQLNPFMRTGILPHIRMDDWKTPEEADQAIADIKRSMIPMDRDTVVFRGLNADLPEYRKAGSIISDRAFISTSTKAFVASDFMTGEDKQGFNMVAKFTIPKGTMVAYGNTYEREIILLPSKLKVVGFESAKPKKRVVVNMQYLGYIE